MSRSLFIYFQEVVILRLKASGGVTLNQNKKCSGGFPEIFMEDTKADNRVRMVVFVDEELKAFLEEYQTKHELKSPSTAARFILRCCKRHYHAC